MPAAEDKLIAKQAIRLFKMEEQLRDMREAIQAIYLQLVAVGGPLNDNKLGYTNEQLLPFRSIYNSIDQDWLLDD